MNFTSLDSLLAGGTLPVREPPDVLSLDLPGTEHEALLGARGCRDEAILVQLVEVGDGLAVRIELALVPSLDGHALLAARLF